MHDLTLMSKKHDHKPLEEFVLLSPAPVDLATKLSHALLILSDKVITLGGHLRSWSVEIRSGERMVWGEGMGEI